MNLSLTPDEAAVAQPGATAIGLEGGQVRIGVSSWSDRSLTQDSDWYPKRTMKAAERIAFYAEQFPLVEIETTFRFPPTPAVTEQWAARTPNGFRLDIQAWSLLTGQPTMPQSMYEDMANEVRADKRDLRRIYATHLSDDALGECWKRFCHALAPLHEQGRLGTVVLRYPRWFVPRDRNREVLERTRDQLGDLPAAVEFSCPDWVEAESCEDTFALLENLGFSFVCVDACDQDPRGLSGAAATTSEIGVVRLLGRRRFEAEDGWSPDWRGYRYTSDELSAVIPRLRHLASACDELHVLVSTTWRDDAVRNGELLRELIGHDNVGAPSRKSL